MNIRKFSLLLILYLFISPMTFASLPSHSPDCSTAVFVDNVYSDFFQEFLWINREKVKKSVSEALLYWIVFQGELTLEYGYLELPPAEIILRNQLCNWLESKSLKSIETQSPDLVHWVNTYGMRVVEQIKKQSLDARKQLISKDKDLQRSYKEEIALKQHMDEIRKRVRKEHF